MIGISRDGSPSISAVSDLSISTSKVSKCIYSPPALTCYGNVLKLTQNGGNSSTDGTGMSMTVMGSDPDLKECVVKIGDHPLGIGLYLFDYKPEYRDTWGHGRQFGVMADEVEKIMPEAVSVHPDGYKMVNYAMLGISRALH